jgi:hypothetical protein
MICLQTIIGKSVSHLVLSLFKFWGLLEALQESSIKLQSYNAWEIKPVIYQ